MQYPRLSRHTTLSADCMGISPSFLFSMYRFLLHCLLITFCIHVFCPLQALADDTTPLQTLEVSPLSVVISEVMWMGSDLSTADEWVEIAGVPSSTGSSPPRSLSGWTLTALKGTTESVIARFPAAITIAPDQYLVVSNYPQDSSRIAQDPLLTSTSLSLPNTKLQLRLRDASGVLVDEVDDGIGNPFAGANPSSNGPKASMERIDLRLTGTLQTNWRTATESRGFDPGVLIFGTPGYPNTAEALQSSSLSSAAASSSSQIIIESSTSSSSETSSVFSSFSSPISENFSSSSIQVQPYLKLKINELLSDPIGSDDAEWIEIQNDGAEPVNLSGMTIRVGTTGRRLHGGSGGLMIEPSGYRLIPKSLGGFTLVNTGGRVQLESGSIIVDTFLYPSYPEGVSAGRVLGDKVSETGSFLPFCLPTPGKENLTLLPEPKILLQSGNPVGTDPVTLNLSVESPGESLSSSTCFFDFGDGFTSTSCNPGSHTIRTTGSYQISLFYKNYCSNTVTQTLQGNVIPKPKSVYASGVFAKAPLPTACTPTSFSGVTISELLPNPTGDEQDGEWIELSNPGPQAKSLCGWSLDDGPGGSHPYHLSTLQLPPESFLILPRRQTKIALNNDYDQVRLIAPLPEGGTGLLLSVQFDHAPDNASYGVDGEGVWNWTQHPSPGEANRFQEAATAYLPSPIRISAAMPNPKGMDTWDEWIELTNTAGWPIWLNGWTIRDTHGKELDLTGTVLAKVETKRIWLSRLGYTLGNEADTLSLIDTKGAIRSILSWENAKEDVVQKPFTPKESSTGALVRQVIDGHTFVVQLDGDTTHLRTLQLLGIDSFPKTHSGIDLSSKEFLQKEYSIALIVNKKIDLQFDTINKNNDDIVQAYAFLDGVDVQQQLLTQGLATVARNESMGRLQEYEAYEAIGRALKTGIWSSPELTAFYDERAKDQELWRDIRIHGISLKPDLPEGIVESGSILHIKPSTSVPLFASINNAPYRPFSGSLLLKDTQTIRVYAEAGFPDTEPIRSPIVEKTYVVDTDVPTRGISISEIYPSPVKGETEWIELKNETDADVSLAGWLLDDTASGGSVPWRMTAESIIPAHGFAMFPKEKTKLALNNSGDDVRLLQPSGKPVDSLTFGSVKSGQAVFWDEETKALCTTQKPTPLSVNECVIKNKKNTQKKTSKSGTKSKSTSKKISTKKLTKNELYALSQSGMFLGLEEQVLNGKKVHNESGDTGFLDGILLGLLISGGVLLAWIFRKKYNPFS